MVRFPVLRWGEPYESLESEQVFHFATGEPVAEFGKANAGLVNRDLRKAGRARDALREASPGELLALVKRAARAFMEDELPAGDSRQTPDDFVRQLSASSGLPERLCRTNMEKLHFVMAHIDEVLGSLTRGLDLDILARGWGREGEVTRSYQAQADALGMVLPSNSPGVHTLWMPVLPLQVGLVMKPGSQDPWTPSRLVEALFAAGAPRTAIGLYPGGHDVGAAILQQSRRALIFGGPQTVDQYAGDPRVQVHGPGYAKILIGEDVADDWERYLDMMVESVAANSGRSCINASGIWTPRHGREIAAALAERLASIQPLPHDDPRAELAAFTAEGQARAISEDIDAGLAAPGAEDATAARREGDRLVEHDRYGYVLPTVVYCDSPEHPLANKEYMFPFVSVVECPQRDMLRRIGYSLVATALTHDERWRRELLDATDIDRLNFGAVPTTRLDWLQPHEGNIVDFLYRARAFQMGDDLGGGGS